MKLLCLISVVIASLFGVLGCKKCEDRLVRPDIKQYFFNFKPGSYWIYKNTQNSDIDSVYVVSRDSLVLNDGRTDCFQEYITVGLKGFAKNKIFSYQIFGWTNNSQISRKSEIDYNGDYKFLNQEKIINGKVYQNLIGIDHTCLSYQCPGCGCDNKTFRFQHLYFAKNVGLVSWEADYHPTYGSVVYELVRYEIVF
jgi:hypothetical protein